MSYVNPNMLYRRFGRTELSMPVFSCGGMRYQDGWTDKPLEEIDPQTQANLETTINAALDAGIYHIETARGYGPSERQLGQYFPKVNRQDLIIQTKVSVNADTDAYRNDILDSLERLQLDYVDLFAIHGINNREKLEQSTRPGGCFAVAQQLRKEGKLRHIGFSTHGGVDVLRDAVAFKDPDTGLGFDYINLHWYYIYQETWPVIQDAAANDMGIFIISPSDKGGKLYKAPAILMDLCKPLHPMTFNDLFCLANNEIHTLSIGASRPTDFNEHLDTLPLLQDPHKHLDPILARLEKRYNEVVEPELRKPFDLGLPLLQDIPGNINVGRIVQLRNLAKAFDLIEYGQMRYNLLGNAADWFPGQNASPGNLDKVRPQLEKLFRRLPAGRLLMPVLEETHELLFKEPEKRLSES